MTAPQLAVPETIAEAQALLSAHLSALRIRRRHFLPDAFLVNMYLDVLEHCAAVETLSQSDVPHASYANARSALEAAVEMMYLTASPDTYEERGAAGRAFELVSLERSARVYGPAADRAIGGPLPDDDESRSPEELIGEEAREWGIEFSGAMRLAERAFKAAQARSGGNWTGLSRAEVTRSAAMAWGEEAGPLPALWDFLHGHLSLESHPGMRTGARERKFEETRVVITPRPTDRTAPLLPARLAAFIAVRAAERAMSFPARPDTISSSPTGIAESEAAVPPDPQDALPRAP